MTDNILIDSCVFVSSFMEDEIYSRESKLFFKIIPKTTRIVIPVLVAIETVVTLFKKQVTNPDSLLDYFNQFRLIPLDQTILKQVKIYLSNVLDLRAGDFIVAATAKLNDAIIVTWDKKLLENKICEAITPTEFLARIS